MTCISQRIVFLSIWKIDHDIKLAKPDVVPWIYGEMMNSALKSLK